MKQRSIVVIAGRRVEVEWTLSGTRLQAKIEERNYDVEVRSKQGVCWLDWNGKSIEAFVEESGEELLVSVGEHVIRVELPNSRKALRRMAHSGLEGTVRVHSPMPGRIVKVLASLDSEVKMNQGIVVMEAMKMQNELKSPKAGRLLKLNVTEGDAVAAGDLIAEVG